MAVRTERPLASATARPGPAFLGLLAVLFVLFLGGMAAWGYQLSHGLIVTGMRDVQIWGLYITCFMLFVGLSAGGLIVASAGTMFGVRRLAPLAPLAIWTSLVTVAMAAFLILPDMGHPERLLNLVFDAHLTSPLVWDVAVIVLYGLLSLVYLWLHLRPTLAAQGNPLALTRGPLDATARRRNERIVQGLAFVALPVAIAVHSVTAWIFGLQPSHPYWSTAILAPLFITSALVSGLGLLLVVLLLARRAGFLDLAGDTVSWLAGLLGVFIAADLFMLFADYLTTMFPGNATDTQPLQLLLSGPYAWVLWGEIVLMVVAFALVFTRQMRERPLIVGTAGALTVLATFLYRLGMVLAGFRTPLLELAPGVATGQVTTTTVSGIPTAAPFAMVSTYAPTWVEYAVIGGILALWLLLLLVGARWLPLRAYAAQVEDEEGA
ncbi:MAG: polysulfide reductase NrfD [Chloroflexi bacterium]|nr:polysulfide reductase NrfD [Chloroflexota bacterium]